MKWQTLAVGVASLTGYARAQDSTESVDPDTGITFQSFTNPNGVVYGLALPPNASATGGYDVILQIVAPLEIGWAGWAWGGSMVYDPLTIVWPNGEDVVVSARTAYGYYQPELYNGSSFQVLQGTSVNTTHFKITAVCTGCSSWLDFDGNPVGTDGTGEANFAYAFSTTPVDDPTDVESDFSIHDSVGRWVHSLGAARSDQFSDWITANTVGALDSGLYRNSTAINSTTPRSVHARRSLNTTATLPARNGAFDGTTRGERAVRQPAVPELRSAFNLRPRREANISTEA